MQSEDFIKPNVSHCVQENDVHYNPWTDPRLIIKYNVTDATQPTQIYPYYTEEGQEDYWITGAGMFDKVEIDGVEVSIQDLDTAEGNYQLSSGEHTVKYTLKDPTKIGIIIDEQTGERQKGALFADCDNITTVTIPNSVTSIGRSSFYNCDGLTSVTIPNSVTSIDYNAFNCENGSSINTLSIDMTVVETWFSDCFWLENIKLGSNVRTVEDGAFCGCVDVNDTDRAAINAINPNALCESYCISATFPQSSQKVVLGNALAYYIDGVRIPKDEIIIEIV